MKSKITAAQRQGRSERFTAARIRLGFTQVEFAALLGVHPITVSKWETGRADPTPWQTAIVQALGTSPRHRDLVEAFTQRGIPAALALGLEHLNG